MHSEDFVHVVHCSDIWIIVYDGRVFLHFLIAYLGPSVSVNRIGWYRTNTAVCADQELYQLYKNHTDRNAVRQNLRVCVIRIALAGLSG